MRVCKNYHIDPAALSDDALPCGFILVLVDVAL
jgi:hypothetical protein